MQVGRVGRGQIFALSDSDEFTLEQALNCIRFHVALMDMDIHRGVNLRPWASSRVTVYTDASCVPQQAPLLPKVEICYLLIAGETKVGAYAVLQPEIIQAMRAKHTYIAHGEALAVLFALVNEAQVLSGCSGLWFIDNMGVLSSLCKGT